MIKIQPKGKTYIATESGEALATRGSMGAVYTPNGTTLQVKRAWINIAASQTATEFIPAVANAVIRIISLAMVSGATATNVTFNSAAVATGPLWANGANGGIVLPRNDDGWIQGLAINEAITITTGAGSTTGIVALFVEIPEDEFNLL